MRVAGDKTRMRVVIDFEQCPDYSYHYLDSPHRIVVDLPQTVFGFGEGEAAPRGFIEDIRYGTMARGRSRLVFTTDGPVEVTGAETDENSEDGSHRLVFEMEAVSDARFSGLLDSQDWSTKIGSSGESKGNAAIVERADDHRFTVVIDPGHGGIDGGARGRNGLEEKDATLSISLALRKKLEQYEDLDVYMTREDDIFVSLGDRVRFAREKEADLFISIHADSIRYRGVRGATVYTVSEKASDEFSQELAQRENKSDAIAGISLEEEPDRVADILIDLMRRETQIFSVRLARSVVANFDGTVRLINNPHRFAGFKVLRAPDVPSILVELGYLSNIEDEKLLQDESWVARVADLLGRAVDQYRQQIGNEEASRKEVNLSK
jgi:N-acetylmuramoyl-L-alanine amidase